jgi:transposase
MRRSNANANEHPSRIKLSAHIRTGPTMEPQRNKVCGIDVHKRFLIATIISRDGNKDIQRFSTTLEDLLKFRDWVSDNECEQVAIESTGIYWHPVHAVLEGKVDLIVANAYKIKHTPGRKTDISDSEWIAELCLNGMIEPSRIFPKDDRELRRLTRAREGYVKQMVQEKNKIHHSLDSACIKLASVVSDIFGKSGMYLLNCILEGRDIDEIVEGIPSKRLKKKADQIKEAIKSHLEISQIILIRGSLSLMKSIQERIDELDGEISARVQNRRKNDLAIAMSMPGMGFISATAILAEIGDYTDFDNPEKLAAWCGLVPSLYQSAEKVVLGGITKQGSKHIRRMLIQVAYAISRTKNSKLKRFFLRIQAKKGSKVAAVALARKVLCILYHLLMNQEMYLEEGDKKNMRRKNIVSPSSIEMPIQEMIDCIVRAGYVVTKRDSTRQSG